MEHDAEKIIRDKVKQTELKPKPWQKDRVWRKVEDQLSPKRIPILLYYAAASILLFSVLSFYVWQLNKGKALDIQLKEIALALEQSKRLSSKIEFDLQTKQNQPTTASANKIATTKQMQHQPKNTKTQNGKIIDQQIEKPLLTVITNVDSANIFKDNNKQEVVMEKNTTEPTAYSQSSKPVHAIIGLESKSLNLDKHKGKKIIFSLFANRDEQTNEIEQTNNVISLNN